MHQTCVMRRHSPAHYSPPRRGYGGRERILPRREYGGSSRSGDHNHGSLLVRNIPLDYRLDELRIQFERFGLVRDVYLPRDYDTGYSIYVRSSWFSASSFGCCMK